MYQVQYIYCGRYTPYITLKKHSDAVKFKEHKQKECGGMWRVGRIEVVDSYDDAVSIDGGYNPYK